MLMKVLLPPPNRHMQRVARPARRTFMIALLASIACISLIAFLLIGKSRQTVKTGAPAIPVATVTLQSVGFGPVKSQVSASGSVAAQHPVDVGAEVSGLKIVEVNVDEGDYVRKGQVLARMNSDILQAQLSRERAHLAGNQASVSKARQPNRQEDIAALGAAVSQSDASVAQAQASVSRAQTNLNNLRSTAGRYEYLGKEGAVSEQEVQDRRSAATMAEAELNSAKQQLEAAKFAAAQSRDRLRLATNGGRQEDISVSLSDMAQTQATIRQIQAQIDQTILRAPSDGLITKRFAEVGEIANVGQPMFSMTKNATLELQAQVQEVDLPAIHVGQTVTISPPSTELRPFTSTVREVSPVVDTKTRLGIVSITVPASSGLKEGMFANALIETGSKRALIVPTKSVLAQDSGKFVFVVSNGRAAKRVVQIGGVNGDSSEVIAGLAAGEQVVVAGAGFLKDGDLVRVSPQVGNK